jgi:oxygen-independent coproporphyrinogen-3 oxidase
VFRPPGEDLAADLYDITQSVLEAEGFEAYEVSNHARGAMARSRHNLVYWRGLDYVGVGPGAHGRLTLDGARVATVAPDRPADYLRLVAETGLGFSARDTLTAQDAAEERLLSGLRILEGVAFEEVAILGLTRDHPRVRDFVQLGLLAADPDRLRATASGRRVLDRLTTELATA